MSLTVFYSWQSDSPKETNRNFLESVLKKAIKRLGQDVEFLESHRDGELALDKDTLDVPGTPPIVETIFNKISDCSVFVPDLTFVGRTNEGRLIPNPNVLIEYGWALKAVGHTAIIPIVNTAFGEPTADNLPFDMRHLRRPTTYHLKTDDDSDTKSGIRSSLVSQLTEQLKLALKTKETSIAGVAPFEGTPSTENPSAFFPEGEKFIFTGRLGRASQELAVPSVQRLFLRLIPHAALLTIKTSKKALDLVRSGGLRPMANNRSGGISYGRNQHGAFSFDEIDGKILWLSQLLKTGEVWGIDAFTIDGQRVQEFSGTSFPYLSSAAIEEVFAATLTNYLTFSRETLRLKPPLRLVAGLTDVKGFRMYVGPSFFDRYDGNVVDEHIVYDDGLIDDLDSPATEVLRPFFNYFWEECNLERPDVEIFRS